MLMTHLEAENIERAIICLPGSMKKIQKFVLDFHKVRLYKRVIKNKMKFHIISGHQTVMGEIRLFRSNEKNLNLEHEYLSINDVEELGVTENKENSYIFAIITLEKEMWGVEGNFMIGYKYDIENDEK
jgi:selenocysteine-specific elongation factor